LLKAFSFDIGGREWLCVLLDSETGLKVCRSFHAEAVLSCPHRYWLSRFVCPMLAPGGFGWDVWLFLSLPGLHSTYEHEQSVALILAQGGVRFKRYD
jgi:hypothetical protein